jgi:hypothetical protein
MIWILDNNPKLCAKYQCDQDVFDVLIRAMASLNYDHNIDMSKWVQKRSQNWMWMFKFMEALVERANEDLNPKQRAKNLELVQYFWDHMPVLPCSPRGKKSKFPPHDKFSRTRHRGIPTKRTIHSYRKLFNETKPGAVWFKGTYQPPWYYGDV